MDDRGSDRGRRYRRVRLADFGREMSDLIDPLTGLASPSILRERLTWLISRRIDDQRPFGLLSLDISNFARVNSTYGVSVGDSILVIAADRMRTCVRPSDVVGRLGNDDFQILYSDGINSDADLKSSVDRVLAALNAEYDLAGLKIEIQVDAAALFVGVPHPESEQIYLRADVNLAVAKREARVVLEAF